MSQKKQTTIADIKNNLGFTGGILPQDAFLCMPEGELAPENMPLIAIEHKGWGILVINRVKGLNTLNSEIVQQMYHWLVTWKKSQNIAAVMVLGAGDKAFCAGGDVKTVAQALQTAPNAFDADTAIETDLPRAFFYHEYRLNHLIQTYPKPYLSFLNGISMGGGMGISIHGSHRIVSETLMMAMPETTIGLFPDVGGGYFLSRMPRKIGLYLALTGARLTCDDAMYLKLGTHYIPTSLQQKLIADLMILDLGGTQTQEHVEKINACLATAVQLPQKGQIETLESEIECCFSGQTVVNILETLDQFAHQGNQFAQKNAALLRQKSPFSLCLSMAQLQQATGLSFGEHMQMEFRMVQRCLMQSDFSEGVRALLIDKDKQPKWQHQSVAEVSHDLINSCFLPFKDPVQELVFVPE